MSEQEAMSDNNSISLDQRALERLRWAKKKDESYSDVILRLISTTLDGLQKRGEKEIVTTDNRRLIVRIDQDRCLGAESCVALAPMVFALDISKLGIGRKGDAAPLGMREVMDRTVASETIISAAVTCPYNAIFVKDAETGEELSP